MAVRVGTCGWSYRDWIGPVYPRGLEARERLPFYARAFPTVEVNVTFYRDPSPRTVRGWVAKVREAAGFELSLKAPRRLTEEALAAAPPAECAQTAREWADAVLRPLADAGRLGAILLQLSPGVLHRDRTLERLDAALAALEGHETAVEFRNRTWLTEGGDALAPDAVEALDARGAAAVVVDGPPFPAIVAGDADHAYVRFHGHNRDMWFRGRAAEEDESEPRMNRYDYRYGPDELKPWAGRLAALAAEKRVVRALFNNHPEGQAFQDARTMEDLLRAARADVDRVEHPQRRLPF